MSREPSAGWNRFCWRGCKLRCRRRCSMRLSSLRFLTVAALFPASFAQAPLQLSLKQAVDLALAPDGNTRVKLAVESIQQAEARSAEARAALLPDVEGAISEQSQTRNLKAFGFTFPNVPILGFTIPTFVGPFDVFDARAVSRRAFSTSAPSAAIKRQKSRWKR